MHVAPWGSPPTPLLPKWYREAFAGRPLPDSLRAVNSTAVQTVGNLGTFWRYTDKPLARPTLRSLARLARATPPSNYVVLPAWFDRRKLLDLPLGARARNSLSGARFLGGREVTARALFNTRGIGHLSLIELMCVFEAAVAACAPSLDSDNRFAESSLPPDTNPPAWNAALGALTRILAAARDFHDAKTLGDALRLDLSRIGGALKATESVDSIAIQSLVTDDGLASSVLVHLDSIIRSLDSNYQTVLEQRILSAKPQTLAVVGRELGLTRERVRQMQARLNHMFRDAVGESTAAISRLLRQTMGPVVSSDELSREVRRPFAIRSEDSVSTRLAIRLLLMEINYGDRSGTCLDPEAVAIAKDLREAAHELADDVGLVTNEDLRRRLPSSSDWDRFWEPLTAYAGLHSIQGRVALRDTRKARVKAAILDIGKPATKREIAGQIGIGAASVGSLLATIPSLVRADKNRWGLKEWIPDPYQGIWKEIVRRIEEDGGATRLERLEEELPRLFNVSRNSVRMYARTPQFSIDEGYVRVASNPKLKLRALDAVIDGRTEEGTPYWTFGVENRHFEGYSIAPFPAELARELGCEPNGSIAAAVAHPEGAAAISVNWPLSSPMGASVGRITESLTGLGARTGDRLRLLVVGQRCVEFRRNS